MYAVPGNMLWEFNVFFLDILRVIDCIQLGEEMNLHMPEDPEGKGIENVITPDKKMQTICFYLWCFKEQYLSPYSDRAPAINPRLDCFAWISYPLDHFGPWVIHAIFYISIYYWSHGNSSTTCPFPWGNSIKDADLWDLQASQKLM